MLAARIESPGRLELADGPDPAFGPHDVLVAVQVAGVCGTDLHILHGTYEAHYPIIPGHEFSGSVAAVGSSVTRLQVGDRVTVDPNLPCGRCGPCMRNAPNQCRALEAVGVTRDGAFAEHVAVPESSVHRLGSLSFQQGALVEPLACVVWGVERSGVRLGDRVLVMGAGPIGCLLTQVVRAAGAAQVVVTDVSESRLRIASALGADHVVEAGGRQREHLSDLAPDGFDLVIDATGLPAVMEAAFEFVGVRGRILMFGVAPAGSLVRVPAYDVFRKDLTIVGSFAVNRTFPQSIALLEAGAIRVDPLVSHRLRLADVVEGFRLAERDPSRMKVQFTLGSAQDQQPVR